MDRLRIAYGQIRIARSNPMISGIRSQMTPGNDDSFQICIHHKVKTGALILGIMLYVTDRVSNSGSTIERCLHTSIHFSSSRFYPPSSSGRLWCTCSSYSGFFAPRRFSCAAMIRNDFGDSLLNLRRSQRIPHTFIIRLICKSVINNEAGPPAFFALRMRTILTTVCAT